MSSESIPVNEYPDRVGFKPDNPYLATFRPYIPAGVRLRELTILPLVMGTVLGIIFGASSLYLVLKVGLTVSASIPVAVISITLFRVLSKLGLRDATILENNVVQTAGSAGESIAFGIGVTMPAILILGFDLELSRVMLVSVLGGLLGILMMIPLRRALIVAQHGYLKYPEGTACAEVLKAGASEESRAAALEGSRENTAVIDQAATGGKTIISGFGIGFLYYGIEQIFKTWKEYPGKVFGRPFEGGSVAIENNPALLGVGYIIGPRIASIMVAGGVLAYLVLIPAIKYFGGGWMTPLAPETTHLIKDMTVSQIQKGYILYIGAGAVAAGGIISLFRSLPVIWSGLKGGLADLRRSGAGSNDNAPRTDQDLSMKFVLAGIIALMAVIMIVPQLNLRFNILGAILIIAFGFLFVTVSSRLTGEVGSSSNPISGMTVATLLLTCLVFLIISWTAPPYFVTALSIGGIVCIAASNGGTTSQDLKTGFLVGATPKYQQIAILVGALASALILGPILLRLNDQSTVYVPQTTFKAVKDAPQVNGGALATLPSFTETTKPAGGGNYRLLKNDAAAPGVAGLEPGEYLVDDSGKVVQKVERNFPATLRADTSNFGPAERVKGGLVVPDNNEYRTWHKISEKDGPPGKYLVDDQGVPKYYVDPGINGTHRVTPDGSSVTKYDAPKATLMSYIIKGILNQQLPWGLVLLGVMIAIVLEMAGIPSLAFAVGVYLPLSSSSPIFLGGMIRWLVDKYLRVKFRNREMTEEEFVAETDKSPGVLMASGYIAGGALAAVFIAFFAGLWKDRSDQVEHWSRTNNPFFSGPWADLLSLLPFVVLMVILYLVGREVLLAPNRRRT